MCMRVSVCAYVEIHMCVCVCMCVHSNIPVVNVKR